MTDYLLKSLYSASNYSSKDYQVNSRYGDFIKEMVSKFKVSGNYQSC